jgi:capsular polysaccharide export protein
VLAKSRSLLQKPRIAATFSQVIAELPHLKTLLDVDFIVLRPKWWHALALDVVVGWGKKDSSQIARDYAERHELPYLGIEDGFLRSVGLGVEGHAPCSLVLDDLGIYYDATCESRLEAWLNADDFAPQASELARAERCMAQIRELRLSKYNHTPRDFALPPRTPGRPRVLVADQTHGDMSVVLGLVSEASFRAMLDAAQRENPGAEVFVKGHPDVLAGKKRGYLQELAPSLGVPVIAESCNPIALLEQVDKVYVATSQLGFEALMLDKPVSCFGAPFYSGWGLTEDRLRVVRRQRRRSVSELFVAAYLRYPRYIDPDTGRRCELEDTIRYLAARRA